MIEHLTEELDAILCDELNKKVETLALSRYHADMTSNASFVDKLFSFLMIAQSIFAIWTAIVWTPKTWVGLDSNVHIHLTAAVIIGTLLSSLVAYLAHSDPGRSSNAIAITIAQVFMSILLIHLSGGRIENHFHVFGSLAFLAQYRRPEVLILATAMIAADHALRGILWPLSVFGVIEASTWRWLEHACWVIFEDVILVLMIYKSRSEMHSLARRWALLSFNNDRIDAEVKRKTEELSTQRKELKVVAERLRTVIDTAHDAYICLDHELKICDWSRRAELMMGWQSRQVMGRPCSDILRLDKLEAQLHSAVMGSGKTDGPMLIETTAVTAALKEIAVEASWSVAKGNRGNTANVFLRDITDRRENAMRQLHNQKMLSIGQLAAGIAHEINTPCQFVGDNLEYLEESLDQISSLLSSLLDADSSAQRLELIEKTSCNQRFRKLLNDLPSAITQSLDGVERISTLTKAMKSFSHPGQVAMQSIDLNAAIKNTIIVCRNEWKYVAALETHFDESIPAITCLPSELNQVWINLIVNAAHAVEAHVSSIDELKGMIKISTSFDGSSVIVIVEDNGVGIPPEIRSRIFDPFFTTKEVGKGTGQGLAIAHAVVTKHHGSIDFISTVGLGTRFIVTLPVTQNSVEIDM